MWQWWVIGALVLVALLLGGYAVTLRRRLGRLTRTGETAPGTPGTVTPPVVSAAATPAVPGPAEPEYLITSVGSDAPEQVRVSDAVVLSAALGEPLVKVVALAHGVRRALTPANRNRIAFEMRQEVGRSRKERRREMREAWRRMKAEERVARASEPVGEAR